MSFDTVVRVALACFFLMVAVSYISRLLGSHARNKRALIHSGEPGSPQRFLRLLFNGFRTAILAAVVWRVVDPSIDQILVPIDALAQPGVEAIGLLFLVLSFAGVEYVHAYMDGEWRSGVPRAEAMVSQLLTEGPYALTRNPLFSAVMLGQVGLFLAIPSVFTLITMVAGIAVLRSQVRIEERALSARFGSTWSEYASRVSRWRLRIPADVRYRVDAPSRRSGGNERSTNR